MPTARRFTFRQNLITHVPTKGTIVTCRLTVQFACALFALTLAPLSRADTIVFSTGRVLTGTVACTNREELLVVTDHAAFNFARSSIKEIRTDHLQEAELRTTNRLPSFKTALTTLAKKPWASDLRPIPAAVIDKGILSHVPYMSFRCGQDYEVNIYGDPERPAGIEVGVYRKLLADASAKMNCIGLAADLMGNPNDRDLIKRLNTEKDLQTQDGLTFEITPSSAEDAYMGWWISAYSERALQAARASDDEMKRISIPSADAEREAQSGDPTSWSAEDLKLVRKTYPATITFATASGQVVSNAQVVRVNEGVSLVWRDGASGGTVKLADLPEDLRLRFGYDPAKSQAAAALEQARKQAQQAQPAVATIPQQPTTATPLRSYDSAPYSGRTPSSSRTYGSSTGSSGGSVYVHGYTRKDGTYVAGHTRSAPRGRR